MKRSLLAKTLRIARQKLAKHPQLDHYPHYSFIVQRGCIIEWATNVAHAPPVHYGYHRISEPDFLPKFHSECFAYKKARGILEDGGFEIVNLRLSKTGEVRMSKPCKSCYHLMSQLGCVRFHYSSELGFLSLATI